MFNISEAVNSDKLKAYKEENISKVEFEPEAHQPSAEDKNAGHRDRLRKRFGKSGFKDFNDYEVLELLLTYAIPRKDTKAFSKNLFKRFGTLKEVLSADTKELEQINGLGRQSVIFIKALNEFIKFYFEHQVEKGEIQFTSLEQIAAYLEATIGSYKNEVVKVLYLNSENKMIHTDLIDAGTVNESYLNYRRIVETALMNKSTSVIIAHNHPDGVPEPSRYDDFNDCRLCAAIRRVWNFSSRLA